MTTKQKNKAGVINPQFGEINAHAGPYGLASLSGYDCNGAGVICIEGEGKKFPPSNFPVPKDRDNGLALAAVVGFQYGFCDNAKNKSPNRNIVREIGSWIATMSARVINDTDFPQSPDMWAEQVEGVLCVQIPGYYFAEIDYPNHDEIEHGPNGEMLPGVAGSLTIYESEDQAMNGEGNYLQVDLAPEDFHHQANYFLGYMAGVEQAWKLYGYGSGGGIKHQIRKAFDYAGIGHE